MILAVLQLAFGIIAVVTFATLLLLAIAGVTRRTEPRDRRLYVVDDIAIRRIGGGE